MFIADTLWLLRFVDRFSGECLDAPSRCIEALLMSVRSLSAAALAKIEWVEQKKGLRKHIDMHNCVFSTRCVGGGSVSYEKLMTIVTSLPLTFLIALRRQNAKAFSLNSYFRASRCCATKWTRWVQILNLFTKQIISLLWICPTVFHLLRFIRTNITFRCGW